MMMVRATGSRSCAHHQVDALASAAAGGGAAAILQRAHRVDPRAGGVDDRPWRGPARAALRAPGRVSATSRPSAAPSSVRMRSTRRVVGDRRAVRGGAADIGEGQARVVGEVFRIDHRAGQVVGRAAPARGRQLASATRPRACGSSARRPASRRSTGRRAAWRWSRRCAAGMTNGVSRARCGRDRLRRPCARWPPRAPAPRSPWAR